MGIDASISGEHARIVYDEDGDFLHIMDGTPTKVGGWGGGEGRGGGLWPRVTHPFFAAFLKPSLPRSYLRCRDFAHTVCAETRGSVFFGMVFARCCRAALRCRSLCIAARRRVCAI